MSVISRRARACVDVVGRLAVALRTRFTEISVLRHCPPARPSELSKISSTAARASACRFPEPLKITSCIESPRSADAETREHPATASMTFDFPQPFGDHADQLAGT